MRSLLLLSCVAASASFSPAVRPPAVRQPRLIASAIRMEDNKPSLPPLPSIQLLLYVAVAGASANDLRTQIPALLANPSGALVPNLFNIGLFSYAVFNLAKFAGFGKTDFYEDLITEDLDKGSLAAQAAQWADAGTVPTKSADGKYEVATFAGGCFWGTELHFQRLPGVAATCVGYTQGRTDRPAYSEVCSGVTGHTEGIQVLYDPEVVTYDALCDKLLSTVDATAKNRVGNDVGTQYRHGLYPHTDEQAAAAAAAIVRKQSILGSVRKVVTEVERATVFFPAEKYHQRYLQKGGQSAEKEASEPVRCYG